jgi:hypothetical protein
VEQLSTQTSADIEPEIQRQDLSKYDDEIIVLSGGAFCFLFLIIQICCAEVVISILSLCVDFTSFY